MSTEEFIKEIKRRPILWDDTHPSYENKQKKQELWKEVQNICGLTPYGCRRKWKLLKTTCCTQYQKATDKYASLGRAGVKWKYWNDMDFLLPLIRKKSNASMSDGIVDLDDSSDSSIETDWEASPLDGIQAKPESERKPKLKSNQMEQFIAEIRKRQVLWNYNFHRYKDNDFKEIAWEEVASIFGVSSDECKRKWECVKTHLSREYAKPKDERTWRYLNQLEFMRPAIAMERQPKPIANENELSIEEPDTNVLDPKYDFAVKLLAAIESNSMLWNPNHSNYKNIHYKKRVWRKIASSLNTTVIICKSKWKVLRDNFARAYANNPDAESNSWVHFQQMMFVAPHLKGKKISLSRLFKNAEMVESDEEESISSTLWENSHNYDDNTETEQEIKDMKEAKEYSTEEFIDEMKSKPMLWDSNHGQYKIIKIRNNAWQDIADCFLLPVEECKRKWRILRDTFVKKHFKHLNGEEITWKYYDQINFLAPIVKEKKYQNISATANFNAEDSNDETEYFGKRLHLEELIEAVRQRALIWDLNNENYKHKNLRVQAWEEIGVNFNLSAEYCKKKWRLLRDTFVRIDAKNPDEKNITWKYFEKMKFLQPLVKEKHKQILKGSQNDGAEFCEARLLKDESIETLIEIVKKHRLLWDPCSQNYKNQMLRLQAWEKIAENCCLSLEECKKKWRYLKDTFARNLYRNPNEEEVNWKYFKKLKFLAPYLRNKRVQNQSTLAAENLESGAIEYSDSSSSEESQNEETEFYATTSKKLKVEDFIESVKQRPVLWDTNDPNHKRHELRLYAWEEIAFNYSWTSINSVRQCKRKWKALRDCFTRLYFKPVQEQQKNWKYYKRMKFLAPYLKTKKDINFFDDSCDDLDLRKTEAAEGEDGEGGFLNEFEDLQYDDSEISATKTFENLAVEEFIEVVKQHTTLWDTRNENYKLQDERHEAWKDIAAHFACSVLECKKKWKVLRDSFVRNFYKPTSEKRIHWHYFNQLAFLGPHVNFKKYPLGDSFKAEEGDDSSNMFEIPKKYSVKDFILEVKKQRILWDVGHEHCRNKTFRQKAWREIACHFSLSVVACKKKWSTLRNAFAREFAKHPENAVWDNFKELDFLLPYLKANSIYSNEPCVPEIGFRLEDGQVVSKDKKPKVENQRPSWMNDFILAVEKERGLWDPNHRNYKKTLKRQQAWNKIAKKFNISISESKKKWKSLRDTYSADLNRHKRIEYSKWKYVKAMEFVRPHLNLNIKQVKNQYACSDDQNDSYSHRTDKLKLKNDDKTTLQFIEAIKERSFLWNWDDVDYINQTKIEEAWNEIAKKFSLQISSCKQWWQSIEDSYSAAISRNPNDENSSWPFFKDMEFLRPFIKTIFDTPNFVDVQDNLSFNDIIEEDCFPEPYMVSKYEGKEEALFEEEMVELITPNVEMLEIKNNNQSGSAAVKRRKYSSSSDTSCDEDEEFYQTLKQKMKKLPSKKKREAKAHIQAYLSVIGAFSNDN